jgi:hypothetical protein
MFLSYSCGQAPLKKPGYSKFPAKGKGAKKVGFKLSNQKHKVGMTIFQSYT